MPKLPERPAELAGRSADVHWRPSWLASVVTQLVTRLAGGASNVIYLSYSGSHIAVEGAQTAR